LAEAIDMLTISLTLGYYLLNYMPNNDENVSLWKSRADEWVKYTTDLIRNRMSEVYAQEFFTAISSGPKWEGFNEEHSKLRAFHYYRVEKLNEFIKELESQARELRFRSGQ